MKNTVWTDDELASVQNFERMLPSQPYFSKMYKGKDFYGDMERILMSMYEEKQWKIKLKEGMTYAVMGTDINTLHFLQFLIRLGGYKRVLELGTYIGVSAMFMAEAGASVTTVEKGMEFYEIAKENIDVNGFNGAIMPICSGAASFLESTGAKYDFILIDCAKEAYKDLLKLALRRLEPGGIVLVDDVFFQGDTLNQAPTTEKGYGVLRMLNYVATLDGYEKVILPVGNGLLMLR